LARACSRSATSPNAAIESYVAAELAQRRLVPLLTVWSPQHQSYYLYYSGRRQLPVPLKTFISFLRQRQKG